MAVEAYQCYSSSLLSTQTTSLSFLGLRLASEPLPAPGSAIWDRISSMILPPYFSVFTFPMTFSSWLGQMECTSCYVRSKLLACNARRWQTPHLGLSGWLLAAQERNLLSGENCMGKYAYAPGTRGRQLPAQFIKFSFQIAHSATFCAFGRITTSGLRTQNSNLKLHWSVPCIAKTMKSSSSWQ